MMKSSPVIFKIDSRYPCTKDEENIVCEIIDLFFNSNTYDSVFTYIRETNVCIWNADFVIYVEKNKASNKFGLSVTMVYNDNHFTLGGGKVPYLVTYKDNRKLYNRCKKIMSLKLIPLQKDSDGMMQYKIKNASMLFNTPEGAKKYTLEDNLKLLLKLVKNAKLKGQSHGDYTVDNDYYVASNKIEEDK